METSGWSKVNQVLGSLRTNKIGEQCENIVKLPSIFEEYPFPILIDAAFLKLGDMFRECNNNFIRFCILKVVLSTSRHHNKITGREVFLRPVLSVIHSNDAVARAITLRLLGVAASLFPEKKNVLHAVIRGLDSHMELERDAALFACKQYGSMSQDVTKTVVPKLEELLSSLSSTETLKIKILDALQSMDYDLETSCQVKELCLKLLDDQVPERVTDGCLKTLTQMALSTLSAPRDVIDLLLGIAQKEMRKSVRCSAFLCIEEVATTQPDLLRAEDVRLLVALSSESHIGSEILCKLSKSSSKHLIDETSLQQLADKLGSASLKIAVDIYQICAALLPSHHTQIHFYPLLLRTIHESETALVHKLLLTFSTQPDPNSDLLFTLLPTSPLPVFKEICYCLSSLSSSVKLHVDQIRSVMSACGNEAGCFFAKLLIVMYEQSEPCAREEIVSQVTSFTEMLMKEQRVWALYCLVRVALCNGVFEIGQPMVVILKQFAVHPYTHNFFDCLETICEAERAKETRQSIKLYSRAIQKIKCCKNSPLTHFQTDYLLLRSRLLKIYTQVLNICNIATMGTSDDTAPHTPTLSYISTQVHELEGSVRELESSMIDARPQDSLNQILSVSHVLSVLCGGKIRHRFSIAGKSPVVAECGRTMEVLTQQPDALKSISFIRKTVEKLLAHRFHIPLFFFVQEASTSISIATNPPIEQGIVKIAGGCNLLLTIEAVVRGNSHKIKNLLLHVTCEKGKTAGRVQLKEEMVSVLCDREIPVSKGYSRVELDLSVQSGMDIFKINAKAVDFNDSVWNVGYSTSFRVKADNSLLSKSQMSRAYV